MKTARRAVLSRTSGPAARRQATAVRAAFSLRLPVLLALMQAAGLVNAAGSPNLPTNGTVSAGSGTINQSGNQLTVNQTSQNLAINWGSFNIGAGNTVQFVQPNASSVALNRVSAAGGLSEIFGKLRSNGEVFLLNPNGVLFGSTASVDVGGLVASSLSLSDSDFLAGRYRFQGSNAAGAVVNNGVIQTAPGGYVALLAPEARNEGVITASRGYVALAAGTAVTLDFAGDHLISLAVDQGALNALAENQQLIQADGGTVVMTAKAANALSSSVVNNSGVIQARTLDNQAGTIRLLGDMASGSTNVAGTLDASAPDGGNGGAIETSAATVKVAGGTVVTTAAPQGKAGTWLIDPTDFTVAPSGGDMTGATLSAALANSSVTIQSASGLSGTAGNVNIDDTVQWSANQLTLSAYNNININAPLIGTGTASLAFYYGLGAPNANNTSTYNIAVPVTLPAGPNYSTCQGSECNLALTSRPIISYNVITSLGSQGSTSLDLQGMAANPSLNYALGSGIDASATQNWTAPGGGLVGFTPVGNENAPFTGHFDGLGNTISGLHIYSYSGSPVNVGLFGIVESAAAGTLPTISNVVLSGSAIQGADNAGGLVGNLLAGLITNTATTGGQISGGAYTGGLVGSSSGSISGSYSTASVTANGLSVSAGGLVGYLFNGIVQNSYAGGTVSAGTGTGGYVGGLVGSSYGGAIDSTYSTSLVSGTSTPTSTLTVGSFVGGFGQGIATATSNSYVDSTLNAGISSGAGVFVTGLSTTAMQQYTSFPNWNLAHTGAGLLSQPGTAGGGGSTWYMYSGDTATGTYGYTYPLLSWTLAPVTVTATSQSISYNGQAYSGGAVTYSTAAGSSALANTPPTFAGTSQGAVNTGTYALTPGGQWSTGYLISDVAGTVTINPASITVSTSPVTKTYDGTLAAIGTPVLVSGTLYQNVNSDGATDTLQGGSFAYTNANAGSGNKTVTVSGVSVNDGNGGNNYIVTDVSNTTSTITPAAITVSTAPVTKTYDGTVTAAGTPILVSGTLYQNASYGGLTATLQGGSFAFNNVNAGSNRVVTVSGVTVNDGNGGNNYVVTDVNNSTSTITPAPLILTADSLVKTYGNPLTFAGTEFTSSGLVAGQLISSVVLSSPGAAAGAHVLGSPYAITPSNPTGDGFEPSNYAIDFVNGTLTVTPRPVTVALGNQTRSVGAANPTSGPGTVTSGNLVFGDSVASVDETSSLAASAPPGTTAPLVGTGVVLGVGSNASVPADYAFTLVNGLLTVAAGTTISPPSTPTTNTGAPIEIDTVTTNHVAPVAGPTLALPPLQSIPSVLEVPSPPPNSLAYAPEVFLGLVESRHDYLTSILQPSLDILRADPGAADLAPCAEGPNAPPPYDCMPVRHEFAAAESIDGTPSAGGAKTAAAQAPAGTPVAPATARPSVPAAQAVAPAAAPAQASAPAAAQPLAAAPPPVAAATQAQAAGQVPTPAAPQAQAAAPAAAKTPAPALARAAAEADRATSPPVATATVSAVNEIRRKVAYLFGEQGYQGKIPTLDTPAGDVTAIGKELEQRFGYEVHVFKDASRITIVNTLLAVSRESTADDSVLIYYAGHGYQFSDTKNAYWIPVDASVKDPKTWISNADIGRFLALIPAKQVILFSDSCFSGSLAKESTVRAGDILPRQEILSRRSVLVMTSGGEEPVVDEGKEGHSIFAWSLIKGLDEANASQPGVQLYDNVRRRVMTEYPQKPQYGASLSAGHVLGGDYLFDGKPATVTR